MEIKTLVTCLQLFGIGFSFGIAGPCLFFCAPILAAYVAAGRKAPADALRRISSFLSGRVFAYTLLGYLAGLSGELLRRFASSHYAHYFKPAGGIISIALGVIILLRKEKSDCAAECRGAKIRSSLSVFIFGFLIGCAPCGPLATLLAEIALISRKAFQGALYALSFGFGTFLSGLIVAFSIAGVIGLVPSKIFRGICALLLILFGLVLLW
jgi:cytochrome c-type biogenesis protein